MKRPRRRLLTALSAAALLLGACGGDSDSSGSAPEAESSGEPVSGGTATILTHAELETGLDPWSAPFGPGTSGNQLAALYDSLIRLDEEGNVIPRQAESVEPNEDFTAWTITLRDGLTFSDGTPFDAEAVKFNWELHQDPEVGSIASKDASAIAGIETPDARTVVATLAESNAHFPIALTSSLGMIASPTAYNEAGGLEAFGLAPVGAGPFKLVEWVRDDHMTLERNDTYWDAPKPYLDTVEFRPVTDVAQRSDTFLQGQADIVFYPTLSADIARMRDEGIELTSAPLWGGTGVVFNVTKPPFDDVRVRKAFVMAIDPELVNSQASDSSGEMVTTIFPEGSPFHVADLTQATNRIDEAQELIDEYVAENGPIHIRHVYGPPTAPWSEAIGQQINQLEDVELELELASDFITRLQEGDFDSSISALNGNDPEPNIRRLTTDFPGNYGGYSNPELDALIEQARTTADVAERAELYERVQEIVLEEDVPFFWLWRTQYLSAANDSIEGLRAYDAGQIDFPELWKSE